MIERYQGTIETEYKKKIFLKHRTMRAITILVVFLCVWFAASPSYALATSDRVDSTTRNQISGNADDDDNTLDFEYYIQCRQRYVGIYFTDFDPSYDLVACTFHFDHVDVVYAYYCCLSFFENSNWNTDNATKSDIDRSGIIYYICGNESGV